MSKTPWKYCFVLSCTNNSKRNSDKYYFRVPYNKTLRDKWCTAVDRAVASIKQCSTAYCCSDHFDMKEDLDCFASSTGRPKLKEDVIPSLRHQNNQLRNKKVMEVLDIFGADINDEVIPKEEDEPPEGLYIREVVYIEENDNDQFLEENIESDVDCLNVCIENQTIFPTDSVVDLSDDTNLLEAVPLNKKTPKLPKMCLQNQSSPQSNVFAQSITSNNKGVPANSSINRKSSSPKTDKNDKNQLNVFLNQNKLKSSMHNTKSVGTTNVIKLNKSERFLSQQATQMLLQYQSSKPHLTQKLPTSTITTYQPKIEQNRSTYQPITTTASKALVVRQTDKPKTIINATNKPNVVNKFKYTNYKEFNKLKHVQAIKHSSTQPKDDDCVLLDEVNKAMNNKPVSYSTQPTSTNAVLKRLSSGIIVKELRVAATATEPLLRAELKMKQHDFRKAPDKPDFNRSKEFELIRLMISENRSLLNYNTSDRIRISKTKRNEFKILENIYYYRANNQFENNYFFMNITQNPRDENEIIQRNYAIYWGSPRFSCVGIVETKGILDEETKDFVFQQVKESLFNETGRQQFKLFKMAQPTQPVNRPSQMWKKIPATIKSKNEAPVIINLAEDDVEMTRGNNIKFLNNVTARIQKPPLLALQKKYIPRNKLSSEEIVQNLQTKAKPSNETLPQTLKAIEDGKKPKNELARLYNYLPSATRFLINKLKYFEIENEIYAVSIDPRNSSIKDDPFNIIFTKMNSECVVTAASKDMYLSQLVCKIFKVINPTPENTITNLFDQSRVQSTTVSAKEEIQQKKQPVVICSVPSNVTICSKSLNHDALPPNVSICSKPLNHNSLPSNVSICSKPLNHVSFTLPSNVSKVSAAVSQAVTKIAHSTPTSVQSPMTASGKTVKVSAAENIKKSFTILPSSLNSNVSKRHANVKKSRKQCKRPAISMSFVEKPSNVASPQTDKLLSPHSESFNHKKKHMCFICSESFERSYQLKRHQFVEHNLDGPTIVSSTTNESSRSYSPLFTKSCTSNLETPPNQKTLTELTDFDMETVIKKEKSDEEITNEKSLLIPLFEVLVNDIKNEAKNSLNDFSLVKCKEEPEERIEDITAMPFSLDNSFVLMEQQTRKRLPINICLDEDTDSATETLVEEKAVKNAKQKRIKPKNIRLKKRSKCQNIKTMRLKYNARKIKRDNSSVIPVKISDAKKFMEGWPTLSVDIVDFDLSNFKKFNITHCNKNL